MSVQRVMAAASSISRSLSACISPLSLFNVRQYGRRLYTLGWCCVCVVMMLITDAGPQSLTQRAVFNAVSNLFLKSLKKPMEETESWRRANPPTGSQMTQNIKRIETTITAAVVGCSLSSCIAVNADCRTNWLYSSSFSFSLYISLSYRDTPIRFGHTLSWLTSLQGGFTVFISRWMAVSRPLGWYYSFMERNTQQKWSHNLTDCLPGEQSGQSSLEKRQA